MVKFLTDTFEKSYFIGKVGLQKFKCVITLFEIHEIEMIPENEFRFLGKQMYVNIHSLKSQLI